MNYEGLPLGIFVKLSKHPLDPRCRFPGISLRKLATVGPSVSRGASPCRSSWNFIVLLLAGDPLFFCWGRFRKRCIVGVRWGLAGSRGLGQHGVEVQCNPLAAKPRATQARTRDDHELGPARDVDDDGAPPPVSPCSSCACCCLLPSASSLACSCARPTRTKDSLRGPSVKLGTMQRRLACASGSSPGSESLTRAPAAFESVQTKGRAQRKHSKFAHGQSRRDSSLAWISCCQH